MQGPSLLNLYLGLLGVVNLHEARQFLAFFFLLFTNKARIHRSFRGIWGRSVLILE